jgi:hypothetical protein
MYSKFRTLFTCSYCTLCECRDYCLLKPKEKGWKNNLLKHVRLSLLLTAKLSYYMNRVIYLHPRKLLKSSQCTWKTALLCRVKWKKSANRYFWAPFHLLGTFLFVDFFYHVVFLIIFMKKKDKWIYFTSFNLSCLKKSMLMTSPSAAWWADLEMAYLFSRKDSRIVHHVTVSTTVSDIHRVHFL